MSKKFADLYASFSSARLWKQPPGLFEWVPAERKYVRTYPCGAELTEGSFCTAGGSGGCSRESSAVWASLSRSQLAPGKAVPCGTSGAHGITSSALAGTKSSTLFSQLASLEVQQLPSWGFGPIKIIIMINYSQNISRTKEYIIA